MLLVSKYCRFEVYQNDLVKFPNFIQWNIEHNDPQQVQSEKDKNRHKKTTNDQKFQKKAKKAIKCLTLKGTSNLHKKTINTHRLKIWYKVRLQTQLNFANMPNKCTFNKFDTVLFI